MKLLEVKMRSEGPNETFANFYSEEVAKRFFCELLPRGSVQMKLLASFTR